MGKFSEWAGSTGPNTIHFAVDTALWPSEKCSTRLQKRPQGAKRQWSAPYKMTAPVHLAFSCCILRNLPHCWWRRLNRYYNGHRDKIDDGPSPLPDVTGQNCVSCDNNTNGTLHTGKTDRLLVNDQLIPHTLLQYHYETGQILSHPSLCTFHREQEWAWHDGRKFWQVMKGVISVWNSKQDTFYSPSKHLAVDQVIILFRRRVIFRQYIPKKHKRFGIKMYELCDETGYTYDMIIYSFLDGSKEISYRGPRFIFVNDM
jgi:hypothetical protein